MHRLVKLSLFSAETAGECWHAGLVGVQTRTVRSVPAGPYWDPSCIPPPHCSSAHCQAWGEKTGIVFLCRTAPLLQLSFRNQTLLQLSGIRTLICVSVCLLYFQHVGIKGAENCGAPFVQHLRNTNGTFRKQTGGNMLLNPDTEPDIWTMILSSDFSVQTVCDTWR